MIFKGFSILTLFFFIQVNCQKKKTTYKELKVPVVFHFVDKEIEEESYSRESLELIVTEVNRRMNDIEEASIIPPFDKVLGEPNLKLFISDYDKNCNKINPITYHSTPLSGYTPLIDDAYLRTKGYFMPDNYLNIWICNLRGNRITGHTPYRNVLNGIIIDKKEFDNVIIKNNDTWTIIHELGHWLGLKHIWGRMDINTGNTIDIDFDDCFLDDGILDTPKQKDPHIFGEYNSVVQDSCGGNGKTNHQNFMDYSYDVGMFTKDQVIVMRKNLEFERTGLLWQSSCSSETDNKLGYFLDSRDNQKYKWVQIGSQKWMAENLNYSSTESICYKNILSNCAIYGKLYGWNEAINVCPKGWRLPNKSDWDKLLKEIGTNQSQLRSKNGWIGNKNGTDRFGFSLYPSGHVNILGHSVGQGSSAKIWLSNESVFGYSRVFDRYNFKNIPFSGASNKKEKLSCRCIQDINTPITNGSALNKEKLRTSMGFKIDTGNEFASPIPLNIEGFFITDLKELYNINNLKRIGLKFLGNGKFEDTFTKEIINQKDIYERIDIERAKTLFTKRPVLKNFGSLIYDTGNYIIYIKLINSKTNEILEQRLGDRNRHGVFKIPNGDYIMETSFRNKANKKHKAFETLIKVEGIILNVLVDKNMVITVKSSGKVISKSTKNKTTGKVW